MTSKINPLRELLSGKEFSKVSPDTLIREVAIQMPKSHSSAAVVLNEDGELIGILTEQDIVEKAVGVRRNVDETTAEKIMTPDPVTITIDAPLSEALRIIIENGFRTLPVLEDNKVVGIVDIRDLYEGMNRLLEEQHKKDESMIAYCFGEPYGAGYSEARKSGS